MKLGYPKIGEHAGSKETSFNNLAIKWGVNGLCGNPEQKRYLLPYPAACHKRGRQEVQLIVVRQAFAASSAYISSSHYPRRAGRPICAFELLHGIGTRIEINMKAVRAINGGGEAQRWRVAMTGEMAMVSEIAQIAV